MLNLNLTFLEANVQYTSYVYVIFSYIACTRKNLHQRLEIIFHSSVKDVRGANLGEDRSTVLVGAIIV